MKLQSQDILKHVLFAGPDRRDKGGIASVTGIYEEALGPITYLTTTHRGNKLLSALRFGLALLQLPYYRLRGFRIIHAHGSVRGSWRRKCLLLDWAGLLGMRTIHHLHSGDMRTYFAATGNEKAARNLRRRDAVVALTRSWQSYLSDELGLTNVATIENPVKEPASHERSRRGEPVNFLFLGAVARTKGILDLLDAIAAHKEELDGRFILHIGGCGPDDALADETIRKHNLGNLVVRHGWVTGEAKDRLIAASDVFILPSYAEGQPISLLESMAASMPAIVTPVGGIPELIDEGVNGVYCTPRDTESIFRAIFHFIEHPLDIETMGERNYIKVRPFFPAPTRDKLINLYTELCNREK